MVCRNRGVRIHFCPHCIGVRGHYRYQLAEPLRIPPCVLCTTVGWNRAAGSTDANWRNSGHWCETSASVCVWATGARCHAADRWTRRTGSRCARSDNNRSTFVRRSTCPVDRRTISPGCRLNGLYYTLRRYLGINATCYLHSRFQWLRLSRSSIGILLACVSCG